MRNLITRSFLLTTVFLGSQLMITNAGISQVSESEIDTFFDISGLESQVNELKTIILDQFRDERDLSDNAHWNDIENRIRVAFDPETLVEEARSFIRSQEGVQHIAAINEWYLSDRTQRMNELEILAGQPDSAEERENFFRAMQDELPPQARMELIYEMEENMDSAYHLVQVITRMYITLIRVMNEYVDSEDQIPAYEIPRIQTSISNDLLPVYRDLLLGMSLFTYRDVSDDELSEYISFYATDAGQWLVDISFNVIDHVIGRAQQRLGL